MMLKEEKAKRMKEILSNVIVKEKITQINDRCNDILNVMELNKLNPDEEKMIKIVKCLSADVKQAFRDICSEQGLDYDELIRNMVK